MKKTIAMFVLILVLSALAGCSVPAKTSTTEEKTFDAARKIVVVSREDGSGTRGAFVELFGVQEEIDGQKVDQTTIEASITNSTSVMMTTVAENSYAIGYISLGSLNNSVKVLDIDGVSATTANIKAGSYKISRPFNIATKSNLSAPARDFVNFILSAEGQAIVASNGYIPLDNAPAYDSAAKPSGKVVVAGSSSVTPIMEKLKEAYVVLHSDVEIEIQQSDSTTGMNAAIDGICDIGMASRELKDSEIEKGLTSTVIAIDGIAVIVNNENPLQSLTSEQVKSIYIGEFSNWNAVIA